MNKLDDQTIKPVYFLFVWRGHEGPVTNGRVSRTPRDPEED